MFVFISSIGSLSGYITPKCSQEIQPLRMMSFLFDFSYQELQIHYVKLRFNHQLHCNHPTRFSAIFCLAGKTFCAFLFEHVMLGDTFFCKTFAKM